MKKTYGSSRAGSGNAYPARQHIETTVETESTERQGVSEMAKIELSEWLRRAYPGFSQVSAGDMGEGQIAVWKPESRSESDMITYELRAGRPYCLKDNKYKELNPFGGGVFDAAEQD